MGASGGVGLYTLQLVRAYSNKITVTCGPKNTDLVKKFGAKQVYDYTKLKNLSDIKGTFTKIIGINGCYPIKQIKALLSSNGSYVAVGNEKQLLLVLLHSFTNLFSRKKIKISSVVLSTGQKELKQLTEHIEKNNLSPYIDKIYSIEDIEIALDDVMTEHIQGKIAIKLDFEE